MADQEDGGEVLIEEVGEEEFKGEGENLSALKASREKHKDNSYYYAQKEHEPFAKDAVVREEDPLLRADGLGPKKLEEKVATKANLDNVRWVTTFSFGDEGDKVKIYAEFPEVIKDAKLRCDFSRFGVEFVAELPNGVAYGFRIKEREGWILEHERNDGFCQEIVPEKCKHRVASNGQRVSFTLAKKEEKEKWHELRKPDPKAALRDARAKP
mmetsp:Transcript_10215/g.30328  ORF Transcript_10215/g.30328 Transcript_10215/m.30328 type:complete len:212 (-) Transcript_10215:45-680(-)